MNDALKPNYKRIYRDLIRMKFPDKENICKIFLEKKELSELDVISLEQLIFGKSSNLGSNKHRSYDKTTIFRILDFQKLKKLNNSQLAKHYGLSRNTVTKWRKIFY